MSSPEHNETETERSQRVRTVFGSIARRYDLANHVLSFGVDFRWRWIAVAMTNPAKDDRLLDMCCGTGDLAFAFGRGGVGHVTGCDFSAEMVELAKIKQDKLGRRNKTGDAVFEWQVGDCTATEFEDGSFDIISCAFGVRNMANLQKGLREMHRLLRPGGRVCILEFTLPKNLLVRALYMVYFRWVLPLIGGIISGKLGAYRYLADSVCRWDREIDLAGELTAAGFERVEVKPLSFGISAIHIAVRQ